MKSLSIDRRKRDEINIVDNNLKVVSRNTRNTASTRSMKLKPLKNVSLLKKYEPKREMVFKFDQDSSKHKHRFMVNNIAPNIDEDLKPDPLSDPYSLNTKKISLTRNPSVDIEDRVVYFNKNHIDNLSVDHVFDAGS